MTADHVCQDPPMLQCIDVQNSVVAMLTWAMNIYDVKGIESQIPESLL